MTPLASTWPGDVQFALRRMLQQLMPVVATLPPPLGWTGALGDLTAQLADVPPPPTPSRYTELIERLALSPVEELILIAAASPDLDPRLASAWQILGHRIDAMRPRVGGLLHMATPDEQADVLALLSPDHVLRALGFVTLVGDGSPLEQFVVADASLVGILAAGDAAALVAGVQREPGAHGERPPQLAALPDLAIQRGPAGPLAIVLEGPDGSGRGWLARVIAGDRGLATITLAADRIASQVGAVARVALLEERVPCIVVPTDLDPLPALATIAAIYDGPWLIACDARPALPSPWRSVIVPTHRPEIAQRRALWRRALGGHDTIAGELARRFPLGAGAIFRAAELGVFRSRSAVTIETLAQAAREQLAVVSSLAERVRTTRRLDELVAPDQTRALLLEILAFARQRRRVFDEWGFARRMQGGLKVLFSGPPGTGKTMSAEIIAAELDLDLFRIDLSNVVSKWVGETEKNLKRAFDDADASGGVLLFDEADALFGKRTANVSSSTDRHANMEINYLLQRLEHHDGIVLLTTNFESAIDDAFKRRLNFRVRFSAPDAPERERLWRGMIPPETPVGHLDFTRVAERFDMAGGNIKNAALRAAILAAADGVRLETRHLLDAAEREFTEIGRIAK